MSSASLVGRMLTLNKNLASAKIPQEQESVQRQTQSMDRAIDRLVSPAGTSYELSRKGMMYGLTDDEIKIVEGEQ